MRFFRFSTKYAEQLDYGGYQACCELSHFLKSISVERITSELNRLLSYNNCIYVLNKMIKGNIVLNINSILNWNIDLLNEAIEVARLLNINLKLSTRFGLIFFSNDIYILKKQLKLLKFSTIDVQKILSIVNFIQKSDLTDYLTKLKIYWYDNDLSVYQYIIVAKVLNYISIEFALELISQMSKSATRMPINGKDLIHLGYQGGEIGEILKMLKNVWLTNMYGANKLELLQYLRLYKKI